MNLTGEIQIDRPQSVPDRPGESGKRLQGRVAIVTGAATGIGNAIAARLAADGAAVGVNHLHTPERADDVVGAISASGGSAIAVDADISQRHQFHAVQGDDQRFRARRHPRQQRGGGFDQSARRRYRDGHRPGARGQRQGTLFGCQLAIEHLSDGGRIINISSSTTGLMLPGYCIYDMTKGAIEQVTRILSTERGEREAHAWQRKGSRARDGTKQDRQSADRGARQ